MTSDIITLIWLFPIAFILHDFEELILFEPWLKKNADLIRSRIEHRLPAAMEKRVSRILDKNTTEFALSIYLIFILMVIVSLLAALSDQLIPFLIASSLFFLHGFMHIGQAIFLRRYIPALITSVVIVIPYGAILFWRLTAAGMVNLPGLGVYFLAGILLAVPFILGLHAAGEYLYRRVMDILVG
jgi:hypothetical protein